MTNDSDRAVVSVSGRKFIVVDAEVAFGDMPEELKRSLIVTTADDIVNLMMLDNFYPIMSPPPGTDTNELIEERKRGLTALGAGDIESVIKEAIDRFKDLSMEEQAKRAVPFMSSF